MIYSKTILKNELIPLQNRIILYIILTNDIQMICKKRRLVLMNTKKREFILFSYVAFGFPFLYTILLALVKPYDFHLDIFPTMWMFFPACGVMFYKLASKSEDRKPIPKAFFITFIFTTSVVELIALFSLFTDIIISNLLCVLFVALMSIVAFVQVLIMNKDTRKENGLGGKVNVGFAVLTIVMVIVFTSVFCFAYNIITGWSISSVINNINVDTTAILILPIYFLLQLLMFFGQEYGCRYYLQPTLQEKFGLRKGVLLVGIIWGLFNVPVKVLCFGSLDTGLQGALYEIIYCTAIGIFLGWAYMKSKNIWLVSGLLFLISAMNRIYSSSIPTNANISWSDVGICFVLCSIMFLPLLFTKEFKKNNTEINDFC